MSADVSRELTEILVHSIGPEASYYYSSMLDCPPEGRLEIKVGGALVKDNLDVIVGRVAYLASMDIPPVLVHGASPQINAAMKEERLVRREYQGLRITDEQTMEIVSREIGKVNDGIVKALRDRGVDALDLVNPFRGHMTDPEHLGRVGTVDYVDTSAIRAAAKENGVAVIGSLGVDKDGGALNINADDAAVAIARALNPHRIITLTDIRGVQDINGKIIPFIDVGGGDIDKMIESGIVGGGMIPKVRAARELALNQANGFAVITSPENLIRELFTHEGAGTLFRRGEPIAFHPSIVAAERRKLTQLIEAAFDGTLDIEYFDKLPDNAELFITDQVYEGAAIVLPDDSEGQDQKAPAYLDKLAVGPTSKGQGIGKQLMRKVLDRHPEGLFWRARITNPQISFYKDFADTSETVGDWVIFISGGDPKFKDYCIKSAANKPVSIYYS